MTLPKFLYPFVRVTAITFLLGTALLSNAQQQKVDSLTQLLTKQPAAQEQLTIYTELVRYYEALEDSAMAYEYLPDMGRMASEAQSPASMVEHQIVQAGFEARQGRIASAREYIEQARSVIKEYDYTSGWAQVYLAEGVILNSENKKEEAIRRLHQALELAGEYGDDYLMAQSHLHVANIHYFGGEYPKASQHYQSASDIFLKQKRLARLSLCYVRGSFVLNAIGNYQKAIELAFKGLKINEQLGDPMKMARSYNNMASIYRDQNNYTEALSYFKRALEYAKKADRKSAIGIVLNNVGLAAMDLEQYDEALSYLDESTRISEEINLYNTMARNYIEQSNIYLIQKQYDKSRLSLQKANDIRPHVTNKLTLSAIIYRSAELHLAKGDYPAALRESNQVIETSEELSNLRASLNGYELRAQVHAAINNHKAAYEDYQVFKQLSDSMTNDANTKKITQMATAFKYEKQADSLKLVQAQEKELLNARLEANALQIRQKNTLLISVVLISILLLTAALILYNYLKRRTLEKSELLVLNNTITQQQIEIKSQRDHLQDTLEELKDTQNTLVRNEKMASLGILIAGIGHEINNPLNFINQSVMALSMKLKRGIIDPQKDEIKEFGGISEGIHRIAGIVTSLRRFSRESEVMDESCNVADIMDGCLQILQSKVRKKELTIDKNYPEDPLMVIGNEGKLHQAFLNFLSNAIDASEIGEEIYISVKSEGDQLIATIRDEGMGMDAATLKKLGDPFFTTKNPGEGTGLGIYISRDIIEAHQGKVSYDSTLGSGTTVTLTLPTHTPVVLKVTRGGE